MGRKSIGNPTPVALPPDLKERAEAEAERRGISLAALVRAALERELDLQDGTEENERRIGRAVIELVRAEGAVGVVSGD